MCSPMPALPLAIPNARPHLPVSAESWGPERLDFWNYPRRWEGIDPRSTMIWERDTPVDSTAQP